jgi:heptosyltransferase-2
MGKKETPTKVLVVQPLPGIGDALWFLPHLVALQGYYPDAELVMLAKKSSRMDEVLGQTITLKNVLWLDRDSKTHGGMHEGIKGFFKLVQDMRQQNAQAAWILHKSPRYALAARLAGIKAIYGYGFSYGRVFSKCPCLTSKERSLHPIEQATALLRHHNVGTDRIAQSTLHVVPALQKKIQERYGLTAKERILVLGIGGSEVYKKWPDAFFADLAKKMCDKGYRVFVLGGPQEQREALLIQALVEEQGSTVTPVFDLPIQESFALINQATLFIGNDTGMLNAAALLNIETYGLFAKTHPLAYRPNLHPLTPPAHFPNASVGDITVEQVMGVLLALNA